MAASSNIFGEGTSRDWIDREIASLRESVGPQPQCEETRQPSPLPPASRRRFRRPVLLHSPGARVVHGAGRALRRHHLDIVLLGFAIVLEMLVAWVISSGR
jgi:hypothetical protein